MTRMLPGAAGADSPTAEGATITSWVAWLHIAEDRAHGRRTPAKVLTDALGDAPAGPWPLVWERWQPGGVLTHRAATVTTAHDTRTLVTACGLTRAWSGWAVDVGDRPTPLPRTWCVHCLTLT